MVVYVADTVQSGRWFASISEEHTIFSFTAELRKVWKVAPFPKLAHS